MGPAWLHRLALAPRLTFAPTRCPAVPKDMQLARRIRGPVYGVCSY